MKLPLIFVYKKLHVHGIALFPFIIFQDKLFTEDAVMMNHERIHHRQQIELLILPFYILYLVNYIVNRFKYPDHHTAYLNIIFEREAYSNDMHLQYLKQRKSFAFRNYIYKARKD